MFVQWRNVKLVFLRELRDQLRDRRTLFMVFILPLLLYPALGIGMLQLTLLFTEKQRTVVLLGEENLPPPALLNGDRFLPELFIDPRNSGKLKVVTDSTIRKAQAAHPAGSKPDPAIARAQALLKRGDAIAKQVIQRIELRKQIETAQQAHRDVDAQRLLHELEGLDTQLAKDFASSEIQIVLVIPRDFKQNIESVDLALAKGDRQFKVADYPRPLIIHNKADEESLAAFQGVSSALKHWEEQIVERRHELAGLPKSLGSPVDPIKEDLASTAQLGAVMWSKLFPALLVIMSMTGAFYPAIDLGAGEKERGTMETLLISPARRVEIVFGKFLTVLCFSVSTAVLNLISIGATGHHMATLMQNAPGSDAMPTPEFPPWFALGWIIVLLLPLAAMFSALCLSLATFARSSKEGQYYLTPLLMVTMGLTVFCVSPGVELTPFYSIMPIAGVALLLKGLLQSPQDMLLYAYAVPVLVTSIGYSLLALWWSIDQFQREEVLFREAERFELRIWLRHLLRDKEPIPTFAHGLFCFVLIMLLQFASFKYLSPAVSPIGALDPYETMKVMLVQQMALIACPALMMGIMLTTNFVQTFKLGLPSFKMLALALLLAVSAHPLSLMLAASLGEWFFPPIPAEIARLMSSASDPHQPLWLILIPFALAPGFCEEIAFRGFILSGLSNSGRKWLPIVLSSIAFGAMHMIPQQVFNAALLGIVLGLIATRSNSLWPCIAFHICFNALAVLHGRVGKSFTDPVPSNPFITLTDDHQILYTIPTLIIAAAIFTGSLWLVARDQHPPETTDDHYPLPNGVLA